jgi:hypothetical protein
MARENKLNMDNSHGCINLKDIENLQSQPTHFYGYVYSARTSFGPNLGPISGYNNSRI